MIMCPSKEDILKDFIETIGLRSSCFLVFDTHKTFKIWTQIYVSC